MRTIPFKEVLHTLAHKIGIDPEDNHFLNNQAIALAGYVNGWVRRLWDAVDWADWSATVIFTVGANHVVPYDTVIGRVLKVYLIDPATVPNGAAFDTPFRLQPDGVFVGLEHGPQVWIKYQPPAPRFTADKWDANRTYNASELAYLPDTGECYSSIGNNNVGHYPGNVGTRQPIGTEITQQAIAAELGVAERPEILVVDFTQASPGPPPSDPPANGTGFYIAVFDGSGGLLGDYLHTANGTDSLATILSAIATNLDITLPGSFTVTASGANKTITIQDNSYFTTIDPFWHFVTGRHILKWSITQSYVPVVAATTSRPQAATVTFSAAQAIVGQKYNLTFIDGKGVLHEVSYTAATGDGPLEVIVGLTDAIQTAAVGDAFFNRLSVSIAASGMSMVISTAEAASIDVTMERVPVPPDPNPPVPVPPTWWIYVPFPLLLIDQVVRGAYSDYLKEQGQFDKAAGEEQAVPGETTVRARSARADQYDAVTDQQGPKSRYAVR